MGNWVLYRKNFKKKLNIFITIQSKILSALFSFDLKIFCSKCDFISRKFLQISIIFRLCSSKSHFSSKIALCRWKKLLLLKLIDHISCFCSSHSISICLIAHFFPCLVFGNNCPKYVTKKTGREKKWCAIFSECMSKFIYEYDTTSLSIGTSIYINRYT